MIALPRNLDITASLVEAYNRKHNLIKDNNQKKQEAKKAKKIDNSKSAYDRFHKKLKDRDFKSLTIRELLYFFREKSEEVGSKYIVSNWSREQGFFKKALANGYTNEDVLQMIEFLFLSEQTYIKKQGMSPSVLISGWCNKIYDDCHLWINDEYTESKSSTGKREWKGSTNNESAKIGGW